MGYVLYILPISLKKNLQVRAGTMSEAQLQDLFVRFHYQVTESLENLLVILKALTQLELEIFYFTKGRDRK